MSLHSNVYNTDQGKAGTAEFTIWSSGKKIAIAIKSTKPRNDERRIASTYIMHQYEI